MISYRIFLLLGILALCTMLMGCGCFDIYPKYGTTPCFDAYPKLADYSEVGIYPKLVNYSGTNLFPCYLWLDSGSKFEVYPKLIECPAK